MSLLSAGLDSLKIPYESSMLEQTDRFYEMLIEKNRVMNLTAITNHDDFVTKHILDSLLIFSEISLSNEKIVDIGTGAGFPGIPLKIFFPDIDLVLIDSLKKRLVFLDDVISELNFSKIKTCHGRAEDLAHESELRETFDLGVSRAVANMSVLSELSLPFIRTDGKFIFYKSYDVEDEMKQAEHAVNTLGGAKPYLSKFIIPGTDILRSFVIVKKSKSTANKYPRKAGTPLRMPL